MTRRNRRPPLRLSSLPPNGFSLTPEGRCLTVQCPDCGRCRSVRRRMICPHPPGRTLVKTSDPVDGSEVSGPTWCRGSGQVVEVDLTFGQWRAELAEASALAACRTRVAQRPVSGRSVSPPPRLRL